MSSSEFEEESDCPPVIDNLDISNDQYYSQVQHYHPFYEHCRPNYYKLKPPYPFKEIPKYGSKFIQHTLAAYDLWRPFFPTYLSAEKFRNFHRPKLRHYNTGPQACNKNRQPKSYPIKNLSRTLYKFQLKLRQNVIQAIESGFTREDIVNRFFKLKSAKQLTAKKGELILFEYSEECPVILSQIGMASIVKTYTSDLYRNKPIYFNKTKPGNRIKVIENNLYRAPIFEHEMPSCDFLVIRTRNSLYVRPVPTIFTVGQIMPLVEIPPPKESNITAFRSSLSNIYIHRMFMESTCDPPSINLGQLLNLFPDYDKVAFRRRLVNNGAEYDSEDNLFRRGSSKYGLLTIEHLRGIFTPERYCIYMSMLAARERLRQLNYTETMIHPLKDAVMEVEVLASPWNVSSALMGAIRGQHYLDFKKHLIDPTGSRREGFSCVAWIKSPTEEEFRAGKQKETDALANLKDKNAILNKIKREKLERLAIYESEAQLIAEIQARALSSNEILSSDEDDFDDMEEEDNLDESFDRQLEDLDKLVLGGRSIKQLNHEKEEEERRHLLREMNLNQTVDNLNDRSNNENNPSINQISPPSKPETPLHNNVLRITRTYLVDGKKIERIEIVRDARVIALYVQQNSHSKNTTPLNGDLSPCLLSSQQLTSTPRLKYSQRPINRSRSDSLGPSELCRAEGTVVRISKKVLDTRQLRQLERSVRQESTN